jgi:hypothetical protein
MKMSSRTRCISSRSLPRYKSILPDWVLAQKGDRATCAENCPGPATQKGCLTARQELSRQRVGLASQDNSDTHDSNAGCGPASTRPQDCESARPARPARQRWLSYKLHISCFSTRLEASCGGIGGGLERAELQATPWRVRWRTGEVALRRRWRTGAGGHRESPQPESWTGPGGQSSASESRSLRTAGLGQPARQRHSLAPSGVRRGTSDGHGWIGSKAVEITGSRVGQAAIQDEPLREF